MDIIPDLDRLILSAPLTDNFARALKED